MNEATDREITRLITEGEQRHKQMAEEAHRDLGAAHALCKKYSVDTHPIAHLEARILYVEKAIIHIGRMFNGG